MAGNRASTPNDGLFLALRGSRTPRATPAFLPAVAARHATAGRARARRGGALPAARGARGPPRVGWGEGGGRLAATSKEPGRRHWGQGGCHRLVARGRGDAREDAAPDLRESGRALSRGSGPPSATRPPTPPPPPLPPPQFLSIPTCETDDALQNFDLDVCAGFLDYVDAVSAGEEVDPVCEPACARQWRTISGDCLSDALDEFAGPDSNITAPTLAYFGACTSVNIAESFNLGSDGVEEALAPAPAPEAEAEAETVEEVATPSPAPEAEAAAPAAETPSSPPVFVNASGDAFSSFLNGLAVAYDNAISGIAAGATTVSPSPNPSVILG